VLAVGCGDNGEKMTTPDAGVTPDAPDDTPMAPPPGITYLDGFGRLDAVSPDGKTVLATSFTSGDEPEALLHLYDTITAVSQQVASAGAANLNAAYSVSNTRRIAAAYSNPAVAALWSEADGWVTLPSPYNAGCGEDPNYGGAFDISADGNVATGLLWNGCAPEAYRWTQTGGTTLFPVLGMPVDFENVPQSTSNRGTVISGDGKIIAGFVKHAMADRVATFWTEDGTGELLDPNVVDNPSEVMSINHDGSAMAGKWGFDGFYWTRGLGMVRLPRTDPTSFDDIYPNAMTGDGQVIYGVQGGFGPFAGPPTAIMWSVNGGTRKLADVARAAGIAIPETISLTGAFSASADGTVIIGNAVEDETKFSTFVLRLPASAVK
jgi:hypothetical protein